MSKLQKARNNLKQALDLHNRGERIPLETYEFVRRDQFGKPFIIRRELALLVRQEYEIQGWRVNNERFEDIGKCHDWRNYVDEDARLIWSELSFAAKGVIYEMCESRANAEEWD